MEHIMTTPAAMEAVKNGQLILPEAIAPFCDKVVITSKFGWDIDLETGERRPGLISRPDHIKLAIEGMLTRLRTDLLYQHRVDPEVSIEDVAGAVKDLMDQGKILHWGASEMWLKTLAPCACHASRDSGPERIFDAVEAAGGLAERSQVTRAQIALAWLLPQKHGSCRFPAQPSCTVWWKTLMWPTST
jgi:aryl-alcohol dehydrogenase-like predicted oxidoreductase